jgi:rubrerythrin
MQAHPPAHLQAALCGMIHAKGETVMKWRCIICGYIHEGDQPPHKCPGCGALAKLFERLVTDHDDSFTETK